MPQQLHQSSIATTAVKPLNHNELEERNDVSDYTLLDLDRCFLQEGECFLFHGTGRIAVESIVRHGFNIRYSKQGLYGHPGIYFSEHAQKADQYADKDKRRSTDLYMFVVTVSLGKTEMYENKRTDENYDTIVGGTNKLFREFVKTDTNQIYPEFLIHYDRLN